MRENTQTTVGAFTDLVRYQIRVINYNLQIPRVSFSPRFHKARGLQEEGGKCTTSLSNIRTDRYQLMRVGWRGLDRVYHTVLHFDIKNGKVWLQQNTTDADVGEELVEMGVPKEDIVLGLHPAYKRPYTGYGVA